MDRRLFWILLAGLSIRLVAALAIAPKPLVGDAAHYAGIARNLAERGEFAMVPGRPTAGRPPLYPAVLSVFARFCPETWTCARVAQAALDTSTIALVFLFGLRTLGRERDALAGALLYALHPVYAAYCAEIVTETLFFWLWMALLLLLLAALEPKRRAASAAAAAAGAGVVMGLAILCRPNFMMFPLGSAMIILAAHRGRARLAPFLAIAVVLSYATLLPWAARNRATIGSWTPVSVGGGDAFWFGAQIEPPADPPAFYARIAEGRTEGEADAEMYRLAKLSWKQNWRGLLAVMPKRFVRFWLTSHSSMLGITEPVSYYRDRGQWGPIAGRIALWIFHVALLVLGARGLWLARANWTVGCTLTVTAAAYYSMHVINAFMGNRYHLPALALCMVFAGSALARDAERIRRA